MTDPGVGSGAEDGCEEPRAAGPGSGGPETVGASPVPGAGTSQLKDVLRALPVFGGHDVVFNVAGAPSNPLTLFTAWLYEAIGAGAPEPHAMTLSTSDGEGRPDARVLILKDLTAAGFWFATSADSAKGRQLRGNPAAALTFYWPLLGRQVRIRGRVEAASTERSAADFLARSAGARAVALASAESSPLTSRAQCAAAVDAARVRVAAMPELVATMWTLCVVKPETIEFWQADAERQHCRLRYTAAKNRWDRGLLWP